MAKPPSDAPVLFDVQSESSMIKQGKDGRYKLVMKGVEKVHWETDDAEAEDGYYSAKKYAEKFDTYNYYGKDAEVSAYKTFNLADGLKEKFKFAITDAKYNQRSNKLVYNIAPKNNNEADKITGIEGDAQVESDVYSTESTRWLPDWMPYGRRMDLRNMDLKNADLRFADLTGADLTGADLRDADLRNVDLRNVKNLTGADLRRADLSNANLSGLRWPGKRFDLRDVPLRGAVLKRANLSYAKLWGTDLSGVNLRQADLRNTDLRKTVLRNADFFEAQMAMTRLGRADLTSARNLNRAIGIHEAWWGFTTCPDGSNHHFDNTPPLPRCSGSALIPR